MTASSVESATTPATAAVDGNTTRVDAFGLPLAMRLRAGGGYDRAVGETETIFTEGRDTTFQRFSDAMPAEFKHLATIEAPYRVPSPGNMPQFRSGGQYADYLSGYASSVGIPATTAQVFGCSGPLASNPDGCAALNRHVAHLPRSQWEDPDLFYQQALGELLHEVLARAVHRRTLLRLPLRRCRGPVLVRFRRRPGVVDRRGGVVAEPGQRDDRSVHIMAQETEPVHQSGR